ncbi:MAG: hypothetical protein FD167_1449 [bacterium]|nr:MAG: hypothetical protein FD167_1449 [bacterium]
MSTNLQIPRRLFSAVEYHQMAETGLISEEERVELIEGEIIKMPGIGRFHASSVIRISRLLNRRLPEQVIVAIQSPVHLNDYSEPQPDVVILRPKEDCYEDAHPTPTDIFWLIEVADTSLDYDKKVKLPLYARSGVPEVWLVNLPKSRIEVYYRPFNDTYQEIRLLHKEQTLVINSFPEISLLVNELLG